MRPCMFARESVLLVAWVSTLIRVLGRQKEVESRMRYSIGFLYLYIVEAERLRVSKAQPCLHCISI